ncbi:DNA alkylation repair protein [Methanobrevibacter sp.]|uniref:DNA alkylation repair protein n=1 Tax=Methanobrevibacter sp. TaxID=66852 RepID=UPI002E75BC12|nr:DNA alkylation repair protein [Methanobrevibacter sp.]MEE1335942.1 DNA alkylation repair protein [Methanobrevibacter sp.]
MIRMEFDQIIQEFERLSDVDFAENMKKFGIRYVRSYGLRLPQIRKVARQCGKNHDFALKLWNHGYHETYLLATLVEESEKVDSEQLDDWVSTFYSWDLVDQACINLLRFIPEARENIFIWCDSDEEFVKRTAFSLIAVLAVHEKESDFEIYFDIIKEASKDNRNFVKKSVNWAIRQIGKIDLENNRKALDLAYEILEMDYKASKWVARGAIRELESEKVRSKFK